MGCSCKDTRTLTGKTFIDNDNIRGFLGTKFAYYLIFILGAVIWFPLMFIVSIRSIIIGKPINITRLVTYLIPKKKKFIPSNE